MEMRMKVLNGFLNEFAIFNLPKDEEGEEFSLNSGGDDTTDDSQDQALDNTGDTSVESNMNGDDGECECECDSPSYQSKKDDKSALDGNPNIDVVPGKDEQLDHDDDELDDSDDTVNPQGVDPDTEDNYKFI
jgi:hypothetical protein